MVFTALSSETIDCRSWALRSQLCELFAAIINTFNSNSNVYWCLLFIHYIKIKFSLLTMCIDVLELFILILKSVVHFGRHIRIRMKSQIVSFDKSWQWFHSANVLFHMWSCSKFYPFSARSGCRNDWLQPY